MLNQSNTKFLVWCDNIEIKITCLCKMVRASLVNDVSIALLLPELRLSGSVVFLTSIHLPHVNTDFILCLKCFCAQFLLSTSCEPVRFQFYTAHNRSAIGNFAENSKSMEESRDSHTSEWSVSGDDFLLLPPEPGFHPKEILSLELTQLSCLPCPLSTLSCLSISLFPVFSSFCSPSFCLLSLFSFSTHSIFSYFLSILAFPSSLLSILFNCNPSFFTVITVFLF